MLTVRYVMDMWEVSLRAQGRSENTRRNYLRALGQFSDWLDDAGHDGDVTKVGSMEINGWTADRREAGRSPATLRIDHTALVSFFKFVATEEVIDRSPMEKVERPKVPIKDVDVISDDEMKALLKACQGRSFKDRRDTAMWRMYMDTGMRKSELVGMTVDGLEVADQVARIVGKGSKPRLVRWGARTAQALNSYLLVRGQHSEAHRDALWLGQRGPLTGDGVGHILKVRCDEAGIRRLHLHQFRHTFAHKFRMAGGNDTDLMTLGGWASTDMIALRYGASKREERAIEAHRRFSPGDDF